ncbi:MAG: hypothetical protein R2717_08560 [Schumannella sp.]
MRSSARLTGVSRPRPRNPDLRQLILLELPLKYDRILADRRSTAALDGITWSPGWDASFRSGSSRIRPGASPSGRTSAPR